MKKLCFLILLIAHFNINSIVILVHGTFATESTWWKPGGNFYDALEQEAIKLNEKIHLFNWAGTLKNTDRIRAAKNLAEFILSLEDQKITIIGHSFGGNVINLASTLLDHRENTPSFCSFGDISEFVQAYRDLEKPRNRKCCKNLIEMVYLLGTPIDPHQFHPNMYVIKYLCNLHSRNDNVQTVLGFYSKTFKNLERCANFEIVIKDPEVISGYPDHYQMHHPIIAQSILYIPFIFKDQKTGGFEDFNWNESGMIEFASGQTPLYTAQKKIEKPALVEQNPEISNVELPDPISLWS